MASREQFSSRIGFVFAATGSAVGLGNVWGFPTHTASNGGGAFVLVYLVMAFCLAYPALMAELIIGRYAQSNAVTALRKISTGPISHALAGLVGYGGILAVSLILGFYAIVAGWMLAYLLASFADVLGWREASAWLTDFDIYRNWLFLGVFILATVAIVARGVTDGIERWSTRLMPVLVILLVLLIAYVLMQPAAMEGLQMYLVPDFSHISPSLVVNAMGQAFFSMSLGVGGMLIYGSYLSKQANLPRMGMVVTLIDVGIAFLAGLLIIPAIFVAQHYGATIYTGAGELLSGPDLIFRVLPVLFESMGTVGPLVALAFFVLMVIASITSSIAMLEPSVSLISEETSMSRSRATWLIGGAIAILSAVIAAWFDVLFGLAVTITTKYSQPLLGMMFCIFAGWIWHRNEVLKELRQGNEGVENTLFWRIWPFYIKYFCPVLIFATFVQKLFE
ncbi:sodium-dependent transporter [Pseudomonadota bacterium]